MTSQIPPFAGVGQVALAVVVLAGCAGADAEKENADSAAGDSCAGLVEAACTLPFPSTAIQEPDASTASGWRNAVPVDGLPDDIDGVPFQPDAFNRRDGVSGWGPFVAMLPGATAAGAPGLDALADSLGADAQVVVIDADSGERIPAWVEPEADDPSVLVIRLGSPMRPGGRHVVALRGLTDATGAAVPAPEPFASIRAGGGERGERFEAEVLSVLEAAGFERASLQLAWDVVVASTADAELDGRTMRTTALAEPTPSYRIDTAEDADCSDPDVHVGRIIRGTFEAPRFTDSDGPGARLVRGSDGLPALQGTGSARFVAQIPCSVMAASSPAFVLQFGHGLFGSRDESTQDWLGEMLDRHGWVSVATDWAGMGRDDVVTITNMLGADLSDFPVIPERTLQGFVHQDALARLVRSEFASDPAFMLDDQALIDSERMGFWGISMGGLLGTAYVAGADHLDRAAINVSGGPFTTLLPRSIHFEPILPILTDRYPDTVDRAVATAALQTLWDPAEAGGWVGAMTQPMLLQTGVGDAQVAPVGAHNLARALGASQLHAHRDIVGVSTVETPGTGSTLVEWTYSDGSSDMVGATPNSRDTDTHLCVRRDARAQDQVRAFLEDGVVDDVCEGPCVGTGAGDCEADD